MSRPSLWDRSYTGLVVTAFALLVFAPTLLFHRVAFDDNWLWGDDSPLRSFDLSTLRYVFTELDPRARHAVGTEYLPVRDVLVALDMAVWGANDQGPHFTQLALYGLSVYSLGTLLIRFGMRRELAWLATLLWAVHPLHVETVAWLSERKGVLAGLFVIASGHAWVRYREGRSRWWLALAALASVCGVWSKAYAMFAPAAFALWDRWLLPASPRRRVAIGVIGGATVLAAIPVILVARTAGVVDSAFEVQPDHRVVAFVGALGHYTRGFVLERAPSLSYPMQTTGATAFDLLVGALFIVGSIALVVWRPRVAEGRAWRIAAVAWVWLLYLPISHLPTRVHIAVADRFVYLWILSGCIGVAWLVWRLRGPVRVAATGALVGILAIASVRAQQSWTNSYELFANAFRHNPSDPRNCQNLAQLLFAVQRIEEAYDVLDYGLGHNPSDPYLLSVKGEFLRVAENPLARGTLALAAASGHASTMWQYAGVLMDDEHYAEALPFAEAAARRRPEVPMYAWRYIELLGLVGRHREAEAEARALLARHPGPASHMTMARALVGAGRNAEAELYLLIARQLGAARLAIRQVREEMTSGPDAMTSSPN